MKLCRRGLHDLDEVGVDYGQRRRCGPCRVAYAAAWHKARYVSKRRYPTAATRIADELAALPGEWVSRLELEALLPDVSGAAIHRALHRGVQAGVFAVKKAWGVSGRRNLYRVR